MSAERLPPPHTADSVFLLDAMSSTEKTASPLYRVFIVQKLDAVPQAEWDAVLDRDDAPLLSWGYLQGLEESGCVGGSTSWQPTYLVVRRVPFSEQKTAASLRRPPSASEGELVAAAPAYLKYNSDGEWVDDFEWAAFAEHKGLAYYPKLIFAVPYNPVGGGRLLVRPELPAEVQLELRALLLHAAKRICQMVPLSSAHVLFPRPEDATLSSLQRAGFLPRQQEQYHFLNHRDGKPYQNFEHFLQQMRSHRRTSIRRERRALREAGYTITTHRGWAPSDEEAAATGGFTLAQLDRMFDLYVGTSLRYTGMEPYLNRRFFHLCAKRLGQRLELVLARDRDGAIIGGAWNLRGDRRLFGRYWGQGGDDGDRIPFLHFECCYYHSVERCIEEGLEAFEPGHGGEHKLLRGFSPVLTHSAHFLREARLRRPIASYLTQEARAVRVSLDAARARCPLPASSRQSAAETSPDSPSNDDPSSRSD